MSNTQTHKRPLYRISFARITGKDENGQDIVGRPKEIGAESAIKERWERVRRLIRGR